MAIHSVISLSLLSLSVVAAAFPADNLVERAPKLTNITYAPTIKPGFDVLKNIPSQDYRPAKTGIPFPVQNESAEPWLHLNEAPVSHGVSLIENTCTPLTPSNPSRFWYEAITHNGESSFLDSSYKANYRIFRNVVSDYSADNTGATDASAAIQKAINAGASNGPIRSAHSMRSTGQPAVVYLPSGTYLMKGSLQLYIGTVLMGDPINPPVLKAAAGFPNDHVIYGKDPNLGGTINFFFGIKNIIIDSTSVAVDQSLALIDWTVSQATQLQNIHFNMPTFSTGHVGVTSQYDSNSNLILNDLTFTGGATAIQLSGQQWILKNININGANTGIKAGGWNLVILGATIKNCETGIDVTGLKGPTSVIDSTGDSLSVFLSGTSSSGAGYSLILDGVEVTNSGPTVQVSGVSILTGNVAAGSPWIYGNSYAPGSSSGTHMGGGTVSVPRSSNLLSDGKWLTVAQPTYSEYSVDDVINIKSVSGLPVLGDGATDDTTNINAILAQYAGCKIIYFPAGTYIVTNTIKIPSGTRIYGEAFGSAISAVGSKFYNPDAPVTMVQVGNPGDVGVAQINDMIFTVADVLQGCKLIEVNMAGNSPGDVGFWNSHPRVGGSAGSKVQTNCAGSPDICKAAWGVIHLTNTSSAYIENMWAWTPDHQLDSGDGDMHHEVVSTGRGWLIEATKGTWLVGTASEHHALYLYNFEHAQNVFSAFQQSETPYYEGPGNDLLPIPWASNLIPSDPTFSNCATDDATCRMAFFQRIRGSSNIYLYGACVWVFFNNNGGCSDDCQRNAIRLLTSSDVYALGTTTLSITNVFLEDTTAIATYKSNKGGWGATVAAYLHDS